MPTFLPGVTIVVMAMKKFIGLGSLRAVLPRSGTRQQSFSFYNDEGLCYRYGQRVHDIHPLEGRLLVPHIHTGLLEGGLLLRLLSIFSATLFLGSLSIFHIDVFCGMSQKGIELRDRLLGQGLEEVPIQEPLREGASLYFLCGREHFQCSGIESLQVFFQGLIVLLSNGKKAELCLT
ncbi:UNVERIFIED_CONTAM: hypothetical protein Slati_0842700 [Sesamum latifolium]|uniref:Uncharacterized protein n=1 Tax=Sesamum latifolium TaxID=2727402 RepID=A0AAW2XM06_9LAMI